MFIFLACDVMINLEEDLIRLKDVWAIKEGQSCMLVACGIICEVAVWKSIFWRKVVALREGILARDKCFSFLFFFLFK